MDLDYFGICAYKPTETKLVQRKEFLENDTNFVPVKFVRMIVGNGFVYQLVY